MRHQADWVRTTKVFLINIFTILSLLIAIVALLWAEIKALFR